MVWMLLIRPHECIHMYLMMEIWKRYAKVTLMKELNYNENITNNISIKRPQKNIMYENVFPGLKFCPNFHR